MYYLQSRYYDANVGRFINSDDILYVVTSNNSIKTNYYCYCYNQVVNQDDQSGKDAVWLQATQSVAKLGHTGLIFKYGKKWYYWYWGMDSTNVVDGYLSEIANALLPGGCLAVDLYRIATSDVPAICKLKEIYSCKTITQEIARYLANKIYDSDTKFDKSFYIKGNFENSYQFFSELNNTSQYNLVNNNCMQTTIDGLSRGKFSVYPLLEI